MEADPNNWEANFFQQYYKTCQCRIIDISSAANSFSDALLFQIVALLAITSKEEVEEAKKTICSYSINLANTMAKAAYEQYTRDNLFDICSDRIHKCNRILIIIDSAIDSTFKDDIATQNWVKKEHANYLSQYAKFFGNAQSLIDDLENNVRKTDSSYSAPKAESSGCYIATAVYGSYDCPQVWTLRRYRDHTLAETWYGRAFIQTYYAISPTLVKWFGETQWFMNMWKPTLDTMVRQLNEEGIADTPYQDKKW